MSQATLRVQKISGHAGSVPGEDTQRGYTVCKLIDTTTCIGCKACEVACLEWNDLPFGETVFDNTYQTMPETRWNYWNLILFNEHEREDGSLLWLMRKNQCMHCAEPGCLAACPADGAISGTRRETAGLGAVHALVLAHEPQQRAVFALVLIEKDKVPVIPARLRHGLIRVVEDGFAKRQVVPFHAGYFASFAAYAGG